MRHALILLALIATPSLTLAQSPDDTAYTKAIMHAEVFDKLGDAMIQNASIATENNNKTEACEALESAARNYTKAIPLYAAAIAAPADPRDKDRKTPEALKDASDFAITKRDRTQGVFDKHCKPA
ncbi:hypothetical protein [Asticcacaulis sp. YBE204]|uniref:hypothetical protein n=1 Tax=Asticcacaulis sp. YBE204 TaxID=1282363 RepID=UPI0003C3AC12|nr:hypothetical protein [Asticcacaulis sp. YBE204]ESQ78289.1 hypothetical protein AEYBE204_14050 [Asticcacaulis sp. YBE204]